MKSQREGGEGAVGDSNVLGLERQAELLAKRLGDYRAGLLLIRLVGEPVLVLGHGMRPERLDQPRERPLLRVAEGEVADAQLLVAAGPSRFGKERRKRLQRLRNPAGSS